MVSFTELHVQMYMYNKTLHLIPVVDGVLHVAAVLVRAALEEEEEEAVAISSLGRVWGGLYGATGREGFSLAALSKLASLSIRNLQRKRDKGEYTWYMYKCIGVRVHGGKLLTFSLLVLC